MEEKEGFLEFHLETLSARELEALQRQRLIERLSWVRERSPFYREKLQEVPAVSSQDFDLEAFRRYVPLTTKAELQAYRDRSGDAFSGLCCVALNEILHLTRTGGTTGEPCLYGLTEHDLQTQGRLAARLWYQIGARKGHTVAVATMGTWNPFAISLVEGLRYGGITRYHFTLPAKGEEVYPLEILPRRMGVQGLYLSARPLAEITRGYGERLRHLLPGLQYILSAGQKVNPSLRRGIESLWGASFYEAYPMTDAGFAAVSCRLSPQMLHFPEDAFYLEVRDPETGEDLTGKGKLGEIVITPLLLEGTPVVRFQTGDMGRTLAGTCPCGRRGLRLEIAERGVHAVEVLDRTIFCSQVEEVLYAVPELFLAPYCLVRMREQPQDRLVVRVEIPERPGRERLREELSDRLGRSLHVPVQVDSFSPEDRRSPAPYKFLKVVTQ